MTHATICGQVRLDVAEGKRENVEVEGITMAKTTIRVRILMAILQYPKICKPAEKCEPNGL